MTDHIGLVYAEIKTKLSGPIWSIVICDENQWDNNLIDHIVTVYVVNET